MHFLAVELETISNTSICLTLDVNEAQLTEMIQLLASEQVAYDIASYRDAPKGIRIWGGATVESEDVEHLMHWLVWAYHQVNDSE